MLSCGEPHVIMLQKLFGMKPIKIRGQVKNNDWGRGDQECMVFQYSGQGEFEKKSYAELWMGSHPSGPSSTMDGKLLGEVIKENKMNELSYLFKILSISKALSIQIHPNKKQAEELHVRDPKNYPDNSDKPELFLTLTPFKALMGFLTHEELQQLLTLEPFSTLKSNTLKPVLEEIMTLDKQSIERWVNKILDRKHLFKNREELVEKLFKDFGYDIGILVSFLLKYVELPPGKAFYLHACQPHAYIEGEILELMKNSDNVVRLGLTPKFKDVKTLLEIVDYQNVNIMELEKKDGYYKGGILRLYEVFSDQELDLPEPSIGLILEGGFEINGVSFAKKDIMLIGAGKVTIKGEGRLYLGTSADETK